MVRETRYLLIGNLPENITEEEISEYFKRYSKIQSVRVHTKTRESDDFVSATVAFADIKSASKAYSAENSIHGRVLSTSYSEGFATGSVVKRTLDEPRPSFTANRPFPRKGAEDGEVYEGRDYYSAQYPGYTEEFQRGRPRDRFPRGGFKHIDRGGHHQWPAGQRRFEGHRSNSSSDRDAFEKPRAPLSPARSTSQTSRKSLKMKRKQSNSTSRSRSGSSDSSSSSGYSDSSSDSSRSRSRSGSSHRASRSKLPSSGSQVKSGRSRSQGSIASENTETTEGGNSPHGIRITNLPARSSDTSLRDGLFHEYKKYGKVNAVQVSGNGDGRFAVVSFKKSEDARKALAASQDKRFFGTNIRVVEHEGIDVDDAEFRPPEAELDEHHPKATRTLFVGNLEKEITMEELKIMFSKFGEILDIDVKRQGAISAYSFIQFTDIRSVVKALRALDGETMGGMKLKLGFGKSMPTNCVWVDNLAESVQENFLYRQFARYGPLTNMVIDRERGKALVFYSNLENAQFALGEMRNRMLNGQKIQIDFASRDCQSDFYEKMEKSGQLKPGQRSSSTHVYQRQSSDGQWAERGGRGKFPFPRGSRTFSRGSRGQHYPAAGGRGYSKEYASDEYRRQRSYDEYSQGGGTPYSEGDFDSDLHAYRTQRQRQRSCSPDQYSDDMYSESYREYKAARYAEYPGGSPGSEPEDGYYETSRDKMYYKERYVVGSREGSPEGMFPGGRSWSQSPSRSRVKETERNTPPTPLGGEDTQDFSSREHSPTEVDGVQGEAKRSGKDDFDITEEDIKELRTSKHSAHRKEGLMDRYARKRSYEDSFNRDSLSKEEANIRKIDRQLSHGSLSDSKKELFNRMKKLQNEGGKCEGQLSSESSDSGSLTGGDLSKLKHERQMLLEKIKQCEDTNNSESDNLDLEHLKKSKRSRLDPWSNSQGSQRLQSELGSVILGAKKDKIDLSQSYRKQMEAMRQNEERTARTDSVKSKKNDIFGYEEQDKEEFLPQGLISPKDLPLGFVKKRRKADLSEDIKSRTYRHKRENEDERMSSDNDESAKTVLRTDSVGSMGSIRHLSSAHSSPRTPITGHLSLENVEHKLSESEQSNPETGSCNFKKIDASKRRSKDDLHSSPLIIPLGDDVLVTELHDPRVPKDSRDEDISLPLPKFAEYTPPLKLNSPRSDNNGSVKEDSPCFSPPSSGSKNESPHSSPNDTNSEGSGSQANSNTEQAYIPPEDTSNNSNEMTVEPTTENSEMEVNKTSQEGEIDDVLSDSSEHNDDFSLAERIRQLDEKLKQLPTTQPSKLVTDTISGSSSIGIGLTTTVTPPSNIYKSKYKIKKRQDSIGTGVMPDETEKGEKPSSEIVKTMLNRSSIFDLDSKRLEQINEKYSPNVKSVVSEDSAKSVTLRTKAEAKEMPLSTLPGSLAGRLGNGGSSFPTLSINTQPLTIKVDDKNSPPLSQEQKAADMCSFNNDSRIYSVSDRMDLNNSVTTNYSPRFNSLDNGVNKVSVSSTSRSTVETVMESADKTDIQCTVDSNVKLDPRLNSKNTVYKSEKTAEENMDLNHKKLDNCVDSKLRHSPKLPENPKSDSSLDLNNGNSSGNKTLKSDITSEAMDTSSPMSLGKRKSEFNSKKDKLKSTEVNSPTDTEKDVQKSSIKSGSESPDSKKVKLCTPEKDKSDKSETDSPTHSDSAKNDKIKKDSEKKGKDGKKKEKSECDSVNKDKGFNDKKDKDHDGEKGKSSAKPSDADKVEDKSDKKLPDVAKKDLPSSKPENDKLEPPTPTKKDNDKKIEHSKKEKKAESSKKSSEGKSDSSHKKDGKGSSDAKVKDKSKSSHKTKDSGKSDKSVSKEGKPSKVSKTGSAEKADASKNTEVKDVKSSDSVEKKESDNKPAEKSQELPKESASDQTKEKQADASKKSSEKSKSSAEKTEKSKSDGSKGTDSKHKKKSDSSDQHKTKSESSKKDKASDKTKHSKPKDKTSDSSKVKDKTTESKEPANESEKNESKSPENTEKPKAADDPVKVKEKGESSKPKSGNGNSQKSKEKSEHDKTKSSDSAVKTKTKHSDGSHSKSKVKEEKSKLQSSSLHSDKTKEKSHKESGKKDDDQSKAESKKENSGENKSSNTSSNGSSSKQTSETSNSSEKKEQNTNSGESKSESKSEDKSENKSDSKSESSSGNTDSMSKSSGKSDSKKDSKRSDSSKSSSKSSSKKSEKKSESRSSEKKKRDKEKESKKEDKTSPKEDKSKKQQPKKEVEFDWSAWMDEPYTSMYDRVKRKSSEKDKEREMQEMQKKFTSFSKSRGNKKHSKYTDSDDSDLSHDSAEETDAFEEEKVAKPSKEVSQDSAHKRKRCVIDTSTSSDDDDSQFYKSFHKNAFGAKDKDKSSLKANKHSVNDIYSSDSSETDIDFPPISPAKKKTKKTKKTKKPVINHESDSDYDHAKEKQKKRKTGTDKPKSKNTPKKKSETKAPPPVITTDTHESDLYDIDSDMDRFDRIKLKNQKKLAQQRTPKLGGRLETTTDDSDVAFSPTTKSLPIKKESKPVKKNILSHVSDQLFDTDSDSSFPDLSPIKNSVTKKNHVTEVKKPAVTVGTGVIAQTIRNEDLGEKKDEAKKKDKVKKKPKKTDGKSDTERKGDNSTKSLFSKVENFILEPKDKPSKHVKKEGKPSKELDYLDEEEITQAEKLVNNMSKLEKPMKHESTKLNKASKHDNDKTKGKSPKSDHSFSNEAETDKNVKVNQVLTNHVAKSTVNHKKESDEKKSEESIKPKTSKSKKKETSNAAIEKIIADIVDKKDVTEANKKMNNKLEGHEGQTKKKQPKSETEEVVKKPSSKLDMDDCLMKKHSNKTEQEEQYKLCFGFFDAFPILEDSKLDEINKKNDKKKKKEEETKPVKKEPVKPEVKTPKKKDKKKKEEIGNKENGPKLEDLVGKLTSVAHNSDVFDFQDEEDDNKPLFADFFKKKEEMNKGKKGDGKNSEKRLSSEEKSDDASSESHEENEEGHKLGHKEKVEKPKCEDKMIDTGKLEDSVKAGLLSSTDSKLDEASISSMFSPKRVKEACTDETKNILAFASPKGIDMGKFDDDGGKSGLLSPSKMDLLTHKDRFKKDLVVGHAELELKGLDTKSSVSSEKWAGIVKGGDKKTDINEKTKPNTNDKTKANVDKTESHKHENKEEKPDIPEKSREEIVEEAVSALQKISEHSTPRAQDGDTYSEGDLVIDETSAAVESVTEEPVLAEQAQNETDLAILSILPMDGESHQYTEPIQEQAAVAPPPEQSENTLTDSEQLGLDNNPLDSSLGENDLVIDTSAPSDSETPKEDVPPVVEKPVEQKEKPTKGRRGQKAKEQAESAVPKEVKGHEVKDNLTVNSNSELPNSLGQPLGQPGFMFGQMTDMKQAVGKAVPEVQKNEPYKKTRKQKAASKANHQVEVPGTFYPPVYNTVDHGVVAHNMQGGDASEKENEEKMAQPYNSDVDRHEDLDNLRVSGDEGSSADKRTRRGRKQQNYKDLNAGVHGRNTSPRSRSSPRSPRTGMSPRQALSPLSSPKSDLSSAPFVKIERLPFGCNKNIRNDGELSNDTLENKICDAVENVPEQISLTNSKKMVEDLVKPPVKDGTSVFDFDDTEPELKIDTTLKPTRQKKGRRNTQETANVNMKAVTPEAKTPVSQNHIISPLESRWQCKKDLELEKPGNHPPLKLTIALTHSTSPPTSSTNTASNVINSATIIDSTIPSIKNKKELDAMAKTMPTVSSFVESIVSMVNKTAPPTTTVAPSAVNKAMSNVDKIIDDVSKGIFDFAKQPGQVELSKEQLVPDLMPGFNPKPLEVGGIPMSMQPSKKRHAAHHNGEHEMMPPPQITPPPGHDFVPPSKTSPNQLHAGVPSPFGTVVMSLPQAQPIHTIPVTTVSSSVMPVGTTSISTVGFGQIGEPQVMAFSQAPRGVPQMTSPKQKPLDMALNMTSKADSFTTAAHSLSTAAVVTQTTTTTMAQQSPGPSVVMSTHKPMVTTNSGNTTVLAGRTVTVKPPNTEAYLHQMGIPPGAIPSQAHQPRMPETKPGFPAGFMPNPAFSRPDMPPEHGRPSQGAPSDKQQTVTSSAPTCVVHPITTAKGAVDPKLLQMMQAVSGRPGTMSTTSSGQPIPPAHMQPGQLEKEQLRNIAAMHGQPMMHLLGQPPHGMPNHIQHKPEKQTKGRQSQKVEPPQANDQRPPSAHSQKPSISESPRPHSAHNNMEHNFREMFAKGLIPQDILAKGIIPQELLAKGLLPQELLAKGLIQHAGISPAILQMYHHNQQMAAKMEEKKGHKIHPPKEMVSPGIAHQPSSMIPASSQSSNPQIKSPALAQTAPSPHPVYSQPSTSQTRPTSPGHKKLNEKIPSQWMNESPVDARNEAQRSRPTSVEPAPSPKHWGYSGSQQPKPAHQPNLDANSKTHQEAIRLIEQHKQQEMMRMQEQERAKIQEIQRQEIQRREEILRQQGIKSRDNAPSTSANTSQQAERDRQTASVPGKPRSNHMPSHTESGPSVMDPRALHHLHGPRGPGGFPGGDMLQGIPEHLYRDPAFQQRFAALRMPPHLLDPHMLSQGYPLGLPHPYLGALPLDHPHMADGRPPSRGSSQGMRTPPPRHQAVAKSPIVSSSQNRQMPDIPPGEGSLLSLLQRYPVMWQGTLALKNDSCAVQMHVISGYNALVQTALPQQIIEGTCQPLRIAQRMRLEAAQLEGVIKRMQYDKDYCMLLALPCGSDHDDIIFQTRQMSTGFIQYLQQKQAAGIVNVADPRSQQPAYVVHIFPPCEFSHETLGRLGFELLHQVRNLSHLLVIITTVA